MTFYLLGSAYCREEGDANSEPTFCNERLILKSPSPKNKFSVRDNHEVFSADDDGTFFFNILKSLLPDVQSLQVLQDGSDETQAALSVFLKLHHPFTFHIRKEVPIKTSSKNNTHERTKQLPRTDPIILLSSEPSRAESILTALKNKGLPLPSLLVMGLAPHPSWR